MKRGQKLEKSEDTKQRLFKVSLELFKEKGFQETTLRDISAKAGVALGSLYYYFDSKDDLVRAFYEQSTSETEEFVLARINQTVKFSERFLIYIERLLEGYRPYKKMIGVLVQTGVDPAHPNSPFGQTGLELRTRSISLIKRCIDGSDLKYHPCLKNHLPVFLWFFLMAIIFFWTYDHSKGSSRTKLLMKTCLGLIVQLLKIGRLPLMGKVQLQIVDLVEELWPLKKIVRLPV